MKKIILLIFAGGLLLSCKSQKTIILTDGTKITQKQYDRHLKKSFNSALKSLSKEEKNILLSTPLHFEYEVK